MPSGRTRQFDVDEALDRALEVFWARGYEGATLPELTRAMGINRPSLYAAFGNKEQLFCKALDRYQTGARVVPDRGPAQADGQGCGRGNFLGVRPDAAEIATERAGAWSCPGALACGEEAETVRRELAQLRQAIVTGVTGAVRGGPRGTATCRRGPIARRPRGTPPRC